MSLAHKVAIFGFALAIAGCTAATGPLEPIPGSITYNGQPRTKLTKSPIGSTFHHDVRDPSSGAKYIETYRIRPDRSLEIIERRLFDVEIVRP
jgi:hypothetical protein